MTTLSIIDIGSNSIHFMLASIEPGGTVHEIARHREQVRLGAATARTGKIDQESWQTALDVVRRCQQMSARWSPIETLITATSAVREAKNGKAFLKAIKQESGITPRLLTGDDEAALTGLAIAGSSARNYETFLNIDIGGGSAEIGLFQRAQPMMTFSLPLGAVRLTELYVHNAPLTPAEHDELVRVIDLALLPVARRLAGRNVPPAFASSGTAVAIGRLIAMQLGDYEVRGGYTPQFQEFQVEREVLREFNQRLRGMSEHERIKVGVNPPRADSIVAGGMVLERAMYALNIPALWVSAWALREGVLLDWLRTHHPENPLVSWTTGRVSVREMRQARRKAVQALAHRYKVEMAHTNEVVRLSRMLFDQLAPLHGLSDREGEWLEHAALLHDIGYAIGHSAHHKHSLYLIKHSELPGFSPEEISIIANVARYHRKALPQLRHGDFEKLPAEARDIVCKLAALVRIADALDRSHAQPIRSVRVEWGDADTTLCIRSRHQCELERWACAQKQDLFQQVFSRPLRCRLEPIEE